MNSSRRTEWVFAIISVSTLRKWEANTAKPSGAAATVIEILRKRPDLLKVIGG